MPKLPDTLGAAPTMTPSASVAAPQYGEPGAASEARALEGAGRQFAHTGNELYASFLEEKRKLDEAKVEDAFNQLRNQQVELSVGEGGFARVKEKQAIDKPILKEWGEKFGGVAKGLAEGLDNDEQRALFKKRAGVAQSQFSQDILQHVFREGDAYYRKLPKATSDTEAKVAASKWNSPVDVAASIERTTAVVKQEIARQGLAADDPIAKDMVNDALAPIYAGVITQAIAGHDMGYAKAVLNEASAKQILDGSVSAHFKQQIEVGDKQAKVLTYSDGVFAAVKGYQAQMKKVQQDFAAGTIDAATRVGAEQRIDHQRAVAEHNRNEGDKYMMGQAQEWILKNPGKSVMEMPTAIYSWSKSTGHLAGLDSFAAREGRPGERLKELQVRGEMMNMAGTDPDAFIAEFKKTGFADKFDLGANGIKEMQNVAQAMISGNGKYRSEFSRDIMQAAVPADVRSNKTKLQVFEGLQQEAALAWRKSNPGKVPTIEDQREVARAANREYINVGSIFNSKSKAYELKEGAEGYMPVEVFNAMKASGAKGKEASEFYAEMKKRGATQQEIMTAWAIKKGAK